MLSALRKLPSAVCKNAIQKRNTYSYIGKPREKLGTIESWCHGIVMVSGIFAIPVYVLTHICEYRGIEKAGKVGLIKKRV